MSIPLAPSHLHAVAPIEPAAVPARLAIEPGPLNALIEICQDPVVLDRIIGPTRTDDKAALFVERLHAAFMAMREAEFFAVVQRPGRPEVKGR